MSRRPPKRPFLRRYAPLLLTGVAVLVVVGIRTDDPVGFDLAEQFESGDDGGGEATTTTSEPEDDPEGTLPPTTTNPNLDDPDDVPEGLRQAQLTEADLPEGWAPASQADDSTAICPGEDPTTVVEPEHAAKSTFSPGSEGPFLTSLVAEFDGDDDAEDFLDAVEDAFDACDGFEDERGLTYEVERTEDVALGDRSVTATLRVSAGDAEVRGRVLTVRVGERVALLAFTASGDADAALAVEALETVVGRLAD